jgi:hypothetical protein
MLAGMPSPNKVNLFENGSGAAIARPVVRFMQALIETPLRKE